MGQPNVGVGSFLGFVEQVGYTTRVLPSTKFLPLIAGGDSLAREDARIETNGIDSIGYSSSRFRRGRLDVSGSMEVEILYEGLELLFKHMFGTVTTSQPSPSSAPNVYDHTFTIADTLPVGLTMEVNRGGTSFFVTGANVQSATINQSLEAFMTLNMDVIGRDLDTGTASTQSQPTVNGFTAPDVTLQWNSALQQVSAFSVTLNNNLDADRIFIGSRKRKQPVRSSRLEVNGNFELEFANTTIFTDFKNATNRSLLISAVGDTIEGGYYNSFTMTLPLSTIEAAPIQVSDEGRITYTADFKSRRSATLDEATLVLRNTVTSV